MGWWSDLWARWFGPRVTFTAEIRYGTPIPPEPDPPHMRTADWDEIPSDEKIKRVPIKPLPWKDGQVLASGTTSKKRFRIQVIPQKPGVFEMDESASIVVHVVARGRAAGMAFLSEQYNGRDAYPDSKAMAGDCGRWYHGNRIELRVLATESVEDPL